MTVIKESIKKDIYTDKTALVRCNPYFSEIDFTIPSSMYARIIATSIGTTVESKI